MSNLLQRYNAVHERIEELKKIDVKLLDKDEKAVLLEELVQLGVSLGKIALEKMEAGHTR